MTFIGFLKSKLNYFIRPEISIQNQMANVVILISLLFFVPVIIFSAIIGTAGVGIWSEILMAVVVVTFLWFLNTGKKGQLPIAIFVLFVNAVLFPMMFFKCGGRYTGMVLWMTLGSTFSFLLLRGAYRYISFVIDVLVLSGCLYTEYTYPDLVDVLEGNVNQIVDIIVAFSFVTIIIGVVFVLQAALYERQKKELLEKEEKLVELNERLENASQAKSDFLANMSHEIRTPINTILGMNEMIIRDAKDPIVLGYAKDVDLAGKQLHTLVNDILDFSRIEAGKFNLAEEDYDMYSIINDCFSMEIGKANEKQLKLTIENNPEIPARLCGDEGRIKQIIINLLTNAIKYTERGSVTIKFDMEPIDEDHINLVVSVKDTGIGISEENLGELFEMFARVEEKIHRNIEGTGLGLAISKQLSELMGGSISVESVLGEGSEFTVKVPQTIVNKTPMGIFEVKKTGKSKTKANRRQLFTAEKASVLIVDDVRVNLNVVKLLLRDTKIQMDLAESGMEAIEYISRKHYDVILMDHLMPEMDGIETLRKIRGMEGNENRFIPAIALTANAMQGAEKMYLESGFCDYITKPVRAPELEESLIKHLPDDLIVMLNK